MEMFILGIFVFLSIPFTMWVATPDVAFGLTALVVVAALLWRSKTVDRIATAFAEAVCDLIWGDKDK